MVIQNYTYYIQYIICIIYYTYHILYIYTCIIYTHMYKFMAYKRFKVIYYIIKYIIYIILHNILKYNILMTFKQKYMMNNI